MFYPIFFTPVYKDYVWGGERIRKILQRENAKGKIAESWEISDREEGMSVVANGPYKGRSLHELTEEMGESLLGKNFTRFPLLIKWIDAQEDLSIQVHPDEKASKLLQGEPKTEMWYFLEAAPESAVLAGLKPHVSRDLFEESLQKGKILDLIQKIPVKKGDAIYIPAGTVHAILAGCFLLEIQQNSNTTYRIYDWDRPAKRELHIPQALQAIHWDKKEGGKVNAHLLEKEPGCISERILQSPYFELQKIEISREWKSPKEKKSFEVFFLLQGEANILVDGKEEKLVFGKACLCPAGAQEIKIIPHKLSTFLRITL